MAAPQRTAMSNILTTCGFGVINDEGLDRFLSFTMISYEDLAHIAKNATRHIPPFSIGVLKMKMLTALKFWIEDKIRMNEPHVAGHFTRQVMTEYVKLYAAFVANKVENAEFVNGPQLDKDDWVNFENDEFRCIPTQVRKLIGFAKHHDYDEKQAVFVSEAKEKRNKRGRQASETRGQFDDPDDAIVDRAISKITKAF